MSPSTLDVPNLCHVHGIVWHSFNSPTLAMPLIYLPFFLRLFTFSSVLVSYWPYCVHDCKPFISFNMTEEKSLMWLKYYASFFIRMSWFKIGCKQWLRIKLWLNFFNEIQCCVKSIFKVTLASPAHFWYSAAHRNQATYVFPDFTFQ